MDELELAPSLLGDGKEGMWESAGHTEKFGKASQGWGRGSGTQ